ncbi:hypothetical protein [Actinophytocola sp.]|uniref:hypothetical protein n=1 Tax=Actinophytocola sp. TaxID=1872138 RepID=UPI002ED07DEB
MTAPLTLVWDLSRDHTIARVDWPDDLTAHSVDGPVRAVITLPGGRTFDDQVARVLCRRDADTLTGLDLFFPPESAADARQRVTRLARQWDIQTGRLDTWLTNQPNIKAPATTTALDATPIGGALPSIELVSSFDEALPAIVTLTFTWPH